jgi:hypothetical protein
LFLVFVTTQLSEITFNIERSVTISNESLNSARRSAKLKQIELAALMLCFPEALQVRVLRIENILDDQRKAGQTENRSESQRGVPAGVVVNPGHLKCAAAGEKSLMDQAHVADKGIT